jgi:general stress protein 26
MNKSNLAHYRELVDDFDTAMLVTKRGAELRARPMAIGSCDEDGRLSFLTSIDSGKLEEITDEPFVNLTLQGENRYLSISGTAMVSRDRQKIDDLWSPAYKVWFPEGKNDPTVTVLEVVPTYAEYWDNSGVNGVRTLLELGRAVVAGEQPDFDDDEVHQKMDFPGSANACKR